MLPECELHSGQLPPGRHAATLEQVKAAFVDAPAFSTSSSRARIWAGFRNYLTAWQVAEEEMGVDKPILKAIWIGGSFVSSKLDPDDIDISPIYDVTQLDSLRGTSGRKKIKILIGHRVPISKEFHVDAFPIGWRAVKSTMRPKTLDEANRELLSIRGGFDSWWQRSRPSEDKDCEPVCPSLFSERGYVEVIL